MTEKRYGVVCDTCGKLVSDADDGLFTEANAHRRAGYHEGSNDHSCRVSVEDETPEYLCPVCHAKCVGKKERDDHAKKHPGVKPSAFTRV